MVKRCIYCNYELKDGSVIDICDTCMYKVWGAKMAEAIVQNMEREQGKGNLELGRVSETKPAENFIEFKKTECSEEVPLRESLLNESVREVSESEIDEFDALKGAEEVVEQLTEPQTESFF